MNGVRLFRDGAAVGLGAIAPTILPSPRQHLNFYTLSALSNIHGLFLVFYQPMLVFNAKLILHCIFTTGSQSEDSRKPLFTALLSYGSGKYDCRN